MEKLNMMLSLAKPVFDSYDTNKNGILDKDEVNLTKEEREKRKLGSIYTLKEGMTLSDFFLKNMEYFKISCTISRTISKNEELKNESDPYKRNKQRPDTVKEKNISIFNNLNKQQLDIIDTEKNDVIVRGVRPRYD